MPKQRAYGADARLLAARETSYGVLPLAGWRSLDFKSTDLSSAQPLGDDPLLGRGRNAQDPYRGLVTDEASSRSRSTCAGPASGSQACSAIRRRRPWPPPARSPSPPTRRPATQYFTGACR